MVRVLLADGEPMSLEYLENLINWEENGYEVIGCAYDGNQAWKLYVQFRPDIVVTDISMPGKNGVELAKAIREQDEETQILFVSGYDDFNYVRDAMRLDVGSYVLKHELNEHTLLFHLQALREKIQNSSLRVRLMVHTLFQQILKETVPVSIGNNRQMEAILTSEFQFIILAGHIPILRGNLPVPRITLNRHNAEAAYEKVINIAYSEAYFIELDHEVVAVLVKPIHRMPSSEMKRDRIFQLAGRLTSVLIKQNIHVSAFYQQEYMCPAEIASCWRSRRRNLDIRYFSRVGTGHLLISAVSAETAVQISWMNETRKQIMEMIEEGNGKGAITIFETALAPAIHQKNLSACKEILEGCIDVMFEFHETYRLISGKSLTIPDKKYGEIQQTVQGVAHYLSNRLAELCEALSVGMSVNYTSHVRNAIEYIYKHYPNPELSVGEIAKVVGLSNNRLTILFRQQCGCGIAEYLTKYRINEAKNLLEGTGDKMYEIASRVGYTNSQYFCKVFKRETGYTPSEYRERGNG